LQREKGSLISKTPPCTKEDLQALVRYVYSTVRVHDDYPDAALARLMWHRFARSLNLGYVQKQHVSVSADGTFYLRLLRVKTWEEQGLTLIPDKNDVLTCPLHDLTVALAMQDAPSALFPAWRGSTRKRQRSSCSQWIFDRGAWDMTKTNKAFV
ncbi:hypothetical protein PHYSODRAFT_474571, partial [Phytophthora sojae]